MRTISAALKAHLQGSSTSACYLMKVTPVSGADQFGITTLDRDVTYDDGAGPVTYRAKRGYTSFDVQTRADLSVDNSQAKGLLAEYPADGVTADGIAAGWYDSARFIQYLINYNDLTMGHMIVNSGQVGQVQNLDDLTMSMEMRSLTQICKQNNLLELTSITCRADYGDTRCKKAYKWWQSTVTAVGAEADRTFQVDSFRSVQVNTMLLVGDGTTKTAQLKDETGATVSANFRVTSITKDGVTLTPGTGYTVSSSGVVTLATAPAIQAMVLWNGTYTLSPAGTGAGTITNVLTGVGDGTTTHYQLLDTVGNAVTSGFSVSHVRLDGAVTTAYTVSGAGVVTFTTAPLNGQEIRWDGSIPLSPDGYFAPGVGQFLSGDNITRSFEVESFASASNTVTLIIPLYLDVQVGDTLKIRQDCDKSWTMCTSRYANGNNFRGEKDLPRADSNDLMAPSQT